MKINYPRLFFILIIISGLPCAAPHPAHSALYWHHGVRTSPISVCFVGDAVDNRPERVDQILGYIRDYEHYANIQFVQETAGTWKCSSPSKKPDGNDYYGGDIRVVIPGAGVSLAGQIPGVGCTGDNPPPSWSRPPDELETHRSCLYNLKLGDDDDDNGVPWKDHTLHEFGHALGLSHEHDRSDANVPGCTGDGAPGGASDGFMTHYDRHSVMHYQDLSCDIPGNYDHSGLSSLDRLAVHILYPEANMAAEFVGKTVIQSGEILSLQSAWQWRGANIDFVAKNFQWRLNGDLVGSEPGLSIQLTTTGEYTLQFSHSDFLDRAYSYTGKVRVLSSADYTAQTAAVESAQMAMLAEHKTKMSIPQGALTFSYQALTYPVPSADENEARPMGVGSIGAGGEWFDLRINLNELENNADVYLLMFAPRIGPDVYLILPNSSLQSVAEGIDPWMENTKGPIDASVFGRIPSAVFPPGTYYLGLFLTPAGSMESHNLWVTQFTAR